MIASNYRKFPEAMALQLVLVFGQLVWHTSRPTTTATRSIRAARGRLVKARAQVVQWVKVPTPAWWNTAKAAAVALSKKVRESIEALVWDQETEEDTSTPTGIEKLFLDAKQCHREYLHTFAPLSQVIERPQWGERWMHARLGTCPAVARNHNYKT